MLPKVYIDGHVGTTGLRIGEWIRQREDIEVLTLPEDARRNETARKDILRQADLAILCLPDDAARQVANWIADDDTRVIDTSTAHRVASGWVYGLPELDTVEKSAIRKARRVANPGCYPSAFLLLVRPLVDAGILHKRTPISIHALSGYSGGGRGMIEKWENPANDLRSLVYEAPYALDREHKHVAEMKKYSLLAHSPQFVPAVGRFRCGMRIQVPLHSQHLRRGAVGAVYDTLAAKYKNEPFVKVAPRRVSGQADERSFDPEECNGTNNVIIHVKEHASGHVLLVALLDNLGKGACGAALQNMNLMLGFSETAGLPR